MSEKSGFDFQGNSPGSEIKFFGLFEIYETSMRSEVIFRSCALRLFTKIKNTIVRLAPIMIVSVFLFILLLLQLTFEGIRGSSYKGDAAIDDIVIFDC